MLPVDARSGEWSVVPLPHLDLGPDGLRCCGEPVPGVTRADAQALLALRAGVPLRGLGAADRARVERARARGLAVLVPDPPPRRPPELLVVSPHPDDAVLSVGGQVAASFAVVLDVFSHETWTPRAFYAARPDLTADLIRREEELAARVLGFEPVFAELPDAPLRRPDLNSFFGVADDEADTRAAVRTHLLAAVERDPQAHVLAPLAIGSHRDHVLCRDVVVALIENGNLAAARVSFYEDLPYAIFATAEAPLEEISGRLRRLGLILRPRLVGLPSAALAAKAEALEVYRVQLRDGTRTRVLRRGRALAATLAGEPALAERLWTLVDVS